MPLVIEENYTASLAEKLKRGELDVILISLPFDEPGVLTMPLYREPFVLLLPSSHPPTKRRVFDIPTCAMRTMLARAGTVSGTRCCRFCPIACAAVADGSPNQTWKAVPRRPSAAHGGEWPRRDHIAVLGGRCGQVLRTPAEYPALRSRRPLAHVALAWRKSFPRPQAITALRDAVLACEMSCVEAIH